MRNKNESPGYSMSNHLRGRPRRSFTLPPEADLALDRAVEDGVGASRSAIVELLIMTYLGTAKKRAEEKGKRGG